MSDPAPSQLVQAISQLERLRLQAPLFYPVPPTEEDLKTLAKAGEGGSY